EMEFATLARRVGGTLSAMEGAVTHNRSMAAPVSKPLFGTNGAASAPKAVTPEALLAPVNYDGYLCLQDMDALTAFIARCKAAGVVAVDTETDALSATHSALVGVSLSYDVNQAAYIPLGHRADDGGLALSGEDLQQIPLEDAIAALKPLLEDET